MRLMTARRGRRARKASATQEVPRPLPHMEMLLDGCHLDRRSMMVMVLLLEDGTVALTRHILLSHVPE